MIKIGYLKEINKVNHLPKEVIEVTKKILTILDNEYGANRNLDDDGGYILIIENKEDLEALEDEIGIPTADLLAEYSDTIPCNNSLTFTNSLILCNNDFGISLIIPLELTPSSLKEYIPH